MAKDIQIFFGVQDNGQKTVIDRWLPIEEYNNARDQKAYLDVALDTAMVYLKDELREQGKL